MLPDDVEVTVCGCAVLSPATGSTFPGGHKPLVGFLRTAQLPASAGPIFVGAVTEVPFVPADDAADMVDVDELVDAREEAEFWRTSCFRGPPDANIILLSSSSFIPEYAFPFAPLLHPIFPFWKFTGGATAVMEEKRLDVPSLVFPANTSTLLLRLPSPVSLPHA